LYIQFTYTFLEVFLDLCYLWQLTISGDRLGCTVEQNMSHHSCSKYCKCSEPCGGLTNRVTGSKFWSHGLFGPIKCAIFAPSPNLWVHTQIIY